MNASPALVCERLLFMILTVAIRPPFPFKQFEKPCVKFRIALCQLIQINGIDSAHIAEHCQLIDISSDGFLLSEYIVKSVYDNDLFAEARTGYIIRKCQLCFFCFLVYHCEVFLTDIGAFSFCNRLVGCRCFSSRSG